MTETLIYLISILFGILGANITFLFLKKYSFGLTANCILGVFGSVLFTKLFDRIGINPRLIISSGIVNISIFYLYLFISFIGGLLFLILVKKIQNKFN